VVEEADPLGVVALAVSSTVTIGTYAVVLAAAVIAEAAQVNVFEGLCVHTTPCGKDGPGLANVGAVENL